MPQSQPPKNLVLYADDDADDLFLLKEAFHDHANTLDLLTFNNGIDLLRYLERPSLLQQAPCLIILDINMPGLSGIDVLRKLRSNYEFANIPVVLFSTSTLPSEAAIARSLNAGFVTKPLTADQIHGIVNEMLKHCSEETKHHLNRNKIGREKGAQE